MSDKLVIALAGTKHHAAKLFSGNLPAGTPLRLVREPDNQWDENAIAVWVLRGAAGDLAPSENRTGVTGWKLGMIPAKSGHTNWAQRLAPLIDRGETFRAEIQQMSGTTVVVRLFAPEGVDFDALAEAI